MKKVTLLCLADDKEETLQKLSELGAVHIVHINEPAGADLDGTRRNIDQAKSALAILKAIKTESDDSHETSGEKAIGQVVELTAQKKNLEDSLSAALIEKKRIEAFGDFLPSTVKNLAEKGIIVRLYHSNSTEPIPLPKNTQIHITQSDKSGQYFALIGRNDFEFEGNEITLPEKSLSNLESEIEQLRTDLTDIARKLESMKVCIPAMQQHVDTLQMHQQYIETHHGMGSTPELAYLQGFCPEEKISALQNTAAKSGWGVVFTDPAEGDQVPSLIKQPNWVKPLKPVLAFLGILPGYTETDISPAFFIFLSIFFAMIIGDAGYGMLILAATLFICKKKKLGLSESIILLITFSISTIIWGILSGNYFGIDPQKLPMPLSAMKIDWLLDQNHSMTFCLTMGGIHLTIAHTWNIINEFHKNTSKVIGQAGWIAIVWTMYFLAHNLLMEMAFPPFFFPLMIAGVSAIVVSIILQKTWMDLVMLLLNIISNFGDLMSYLRLFALGIAGVKVAEAFNSMALDLGSYIMSGISSEPLAYAAAAVPVVAILIFGHVLNLGLCILSVLVHGVRLNTLEFSMHMGLEWAGIKYKPFAGKKCDSAEAVAT